jgi:hypothetical protein
MGAGVLLAEADTGHFGESGDKVGQKINPSIYEDQFERKL